MPLALQSLLALLLGGVALLALMLGVLTVRLLRLRWQPVHSRTVAADSLEPALRRQLASAAPPLEALGFRYLWSGSADRALVGPDDAAQGFDVYRHQDGHTHALVSPAPLPEANQACLIQMISCLNNGNNWTTANGSRHFFPFDFPRWPVFDDYLPDWSQAWQRHLQRVQAAHGHICTDAAEVQRRLHLSFEKLVPTLARQGKLVAAAPGPHWRLSLRAAWAMALAALWGQWRAAWARRGQRAQPEAAPLASPASGEAADAFQADLRAFAAQRALLRSAPTSTRRKWALFLVTALLFLLVGAWWTSWAFVPIVLAVVALHEGGHYLAMRCTGYRNVSVFFLPGLGGLAVGEKPDATPVQKLVVYLAGPMPGIVVAVLAYAWAASGHASGPSWLHQFLLVSLVINYLNLLPLVPLDGGRVMEMLVFARHPKLRFGFAALCALALFALGTALDDTVLRVVAAMIGLSLPGQWRRTQLEARLERQGTAALDESTALQRIFGALQASTFRRWTFDQRSAAASALLPELMGRRANGAEIVLGLVVYAACLLLPPAALVLTVPQIVPAFSFLAQQVRIPADDVDPEPAPLLPEPESEPDWTAHLAQLAQQSPERQLNILLGAAQQAARADDAPTALRHYQAAWQRALQLPVRDMRRIDTLEGLAAFAADEAQRRAYLQQILTELDTPAGMERLRVASALEQLAYGEPPGQRVTLLHQALQLRLVGLGSEAALAATQMQLAHALDESGDRAGAEQQLRARLDALSSPATHDRTRAALQQRVLHVRYQVDLVWFHLGHDQWEQAQALVQQAEQALPTLTTTSWVFPSQMVREAAFWNALLNPQHPELVTRWQAYDAQHPSKHLGAPGSVVHALDRAMLARARADAELLASAKAALAQGRAQSPAALQRWCQPVDLPDVGWRNAQRRARQALLT